MPNSLSSSSSTAQKTAVATLTYHIGVAIEMDYGVSGSGAYTFEYGQNLPSAENALKTYFKYKNTLHGEFKQYYTDAQWLDMLRADLDLSHPVIYSGSDTSGGHCFVCDGYNNNNQFHFNWGWGGYCDGYYTIGSLNPNPGGTGGNATYTFNLNNGAVFGIEPDGSLRVDPQLVSLPQEGGSATVHVSSCSNISTSWTASASQSWVSVSPATGSGSGAVTNLTISASANNTGATRTAVVTINHGGQTATVNVAQLGCSSSDMCDIVLVLNDAYGDGWNGASITVQSISGLVYGNFTLSSGDQENIPLSVCPESLQFVWNTGSWDEECSFEVDDEWGNVLLSQNAPSASGNYVVNAPCANNPCSDITTFPYTMGFETTDPINCWTFVDSDGDGYGWTNEFLVGEDYAHGGEYFMASASYVNDVGALQPDNWMISPAIVVPASGLTLSWYAAAQDADYPDEYYAVYVSTTGSSTTDFTTAVYQGIVEGATYTQKTVYLDAYAGQTVHIAFRHFNVTDQYWLKIDDISLTAASGPSYTITTAVNDNTMGTVTGGGSYPQGTSVTLNATPNSGYRFVQWQDGITTNPRTITVTGNATYTATFASIWGDTLYYDNGTFATSVGTQSEFYWGIKFEANALAGRNYLTDVMLYVPGSGAGSYQLNIYQGGSTAPLTLACTQSQTYATADENAWKTIHINTPVALNASQPLWVTFYTEDVDYPAASCDFTGDYNGSMLSLDGSSWTSVQAASGGDLDYTWMIRAITAETAGDYVISATSANPAMGSVSGGGSYAAGATATLVATPNIGYHFVQWQDGNADNPRTITVTGNATYVATFAADVPTSYTITVTSANPTMGNVTGGGSYVEGSQATLTATANSGYHFVSWQDGNTDNPRTITVTGDATYTATFAENPPVTYTVTAISANPDMGTVSGGGVYEAGATVTLTATPFNGYHFVRWNNGITTNPYTFAVSEDVTLSAEFAIDVAIEDVENMAVRLYPNPTTGILNIEAEGVQNVEIFDAVGRMVSQSDATNQIDLGPLAPGIYTIRLTLPQGTIIRKVVRK